MRIGSCRARVYKHRSAGSRWQRVVAFGFGLWWTCTSLPCLCILSWSRTRLISAHEATDYLDRSNDNRLQLSPAVTSALSRGEDLRCVACMSFERKRKVLCNYGRIPCAAGSARGSRCSPWVYWSHVVGPAQKFGRFLCDCDGRGPSWFSSKSPPRLLTSIHFTSLVGLNCRGYRRQVPQKLPGKSFFTFPIHFLASG